MRGGRGRRRYQRGRRLAALDNWPRSAGGLMGAELQERRMPLLSLNLSREEAANLKQIARRRKCSKSELARRVIAAYLQEVGEAEQADDRGHNWTAFGSLFIEAYEQMAVNLIAALEAFGKAFGDRGDQPCGTGVGSPVATAYEIFCREVAGRPQGCATNQGLDFSVADALVATGATGAVADDVYELAVPLDQLFQDYCTAVGQQAFEDLPAIFSRAWIRLEGHQQK